MTEPISKSNPFVLSVAERSFAESKHLHFCDLWPFDFAPSALRSEPAPDSIQGRTGF